MCEAKPTNDGKRSEAAEEDLRASFFFLKINNSNKKNTPLSRKSSQQGVLKNRCATLAMSLFHLNYILVFMKQDLHISSFMD